MVLPSELAILMRPSLVLPFSVIARAPLVLLLLVSTIDEVRDMLRENVSRWQWLVGAAATPRAHVHGSAAAGGRRLSLAPAIKGHAMCSARRRLKPRIRCVLLLVTNWPWSQTGIVRSA
jgi:hypothetical protein